MKSYNETNLLTGGVALFAWMAISLASTSAPAGTFHWGDIVGSDVMFLDVTENNGEAQSLFAPMPGSGGADCDGKYLAPRSPRVLLAILQ